MITPISYFLSSIYLIYFLLCLLIFHPIQMLCFHLLGEKAHQKSVQALNFFLIYGTYLVGARPKLIWKTPKLPTGRTYLLVANHESMFDIIGIIWFLRQYYPIFVSKQSLAKGIPSISYNLRKSGAALIDRNDGKGAMVKIMKMGEYIKKQGFSGAIFPEGTRSGKIPNQLNDFKAAGLAALIKRNPEALVVPVAITNTGIFDPKLFFPLRAATPISWTVLPPIDTKGKTADEVAALCKSAIGQVLALAV